ncbi:ATP synthase F1 subunit gamma [Holophaga foetida]|uniref:ATP synthase F1 subunit gamma n=1 Tax=Holophaga foetida TaxID=35839 RepID=UPI00024750E5|nr:ATP synthase F1 subunit gamma [Holophaga foetida]
MANVQDIRRRIKSVKNTQQVTKAMKMISAVKLRKTQERLLALRPYSTKLDEVVRHVVGRLRAVPTLQPGPVAQAFLAPREEKNIHLVLVASDKGLCGGFNANVLREAQAFLRDCPSHVAHFQAIGKRSIEWARKRQLKANGEHTGLAVTELKQVASEIAAQAAEQYEKGEIDALYVVFNYFQSAVAQVPMVMRVFPVEIEPHVEFRAETPHLLEPDPNEVLEHLLPLYIETELLRCLLESSTSEHGARMAAMDKASSNAEEMIAKLTLNMNKIRQASITNQIIEIVSGANA